MAKKKSSHARRPVLELPLNPADIAVQTAEKAARAERERCLAILRELEARYTPPDSHVGSIVLAEVNALREAARRIAQQGGT